jgi:RHS repeat-associated protein
MAPSSHETEPPAIPGRFTVSSSGYNRLGWKGLVWEGDSTSMYYVRNRWYDPNVGRFITEDPIGLTGGMNLYLYGGADQINLNDVLGLDDCPATTPVEPGIARADSGGWWPTFVAVTGESRGPTAEVGEIGAAPSDTVPPFPPICELPVSVPEPQPAPTTPFVGPVSPDPFDASGMCSICRESFGGPPEGEGGTITTYGGGQHLLSVSRSLNSRQVGDVVMRGAFLTYINGCPANVTFFDIAADGVEESWDLGPNAFAWLKKHLHFQVTYSGFYHSRLSGYRGVPAVASVNCDTGRGHVTTMPFIQLFP